MVTIGCIVLFLASDCVTSRSLVPPPSAMARHLAGAPRFADFALLGKTKMRPDPV